MRLRIAKKEEGTRLMRLSVRVLSVAFALVLSSLMIAALGYDVTRVFDALFIGAFGTSTGLINTIHIAIPLAVTALGLSVAFKMSYWNIGGEGQFIMGCIFATYISHNAPLQNGIALWLLMALAGFIGGAIWALIPGIFRVLFRANETLFTLMMNYIAYALLGYLYYDLWLDPSRNNFPGIKSIEMHARLVRLGGIHIGWVVLLLLALLIFIMMRHTKLGFELRVVGQSEPTARYAGMSVRKIMLYGVMISGGIVGLAGVIKLTGQVYDLSPGITSNAGFTAIIVAWLSNLSSPIILLVSVFIAALEQSGQVMQMYSIPSHVARIIQGTILLSALAGEFFLRYKIVRVTHARPKKEISTDGL